MIATNDNKDVFGTRKMTIAKAAVDPVFETFSQMFANCPGAVRQVREILGSGMMLDFWFGFAYSTRHAVFYKYRQDGVTHTAFALLEKE